MIREPRKLLRALVHSCARASGLGSGCGANRHRIRIDGFAAISLALCFSFLPMTASSDDWDDEQLFYVEGGTYFSVGFSYLAEVFSNKIGESDTDKGFHRVDGNVRGAEGINAVFGKRAFEYIAVELQFEFSDGFQFDDEDGDHFDLKVYTTTFNSKVYPLHWLLKSVNEGRIQPHLIGGIGLMVNHDLDIDTGASAAVRGGAGIDYFFNPKWAINLKSSYVHPFGQLKGLRYVTTSLGLTYQLE